MVQFSYKRENKMRLVHLTESRWPKNGYNLTEKNWQQQTLTLELDLNFTTTNVNFWTWPKYSWIWLKTKYSPVNVCRCSNIYYIFDFRSYSPANIRHCGNIYYIFGHIHHVMIHHCQFFGHVHSVILIRSSEKPSKFFLKRFILKAFATQDFSIKFIHESVLN